MSVVHPHEVEVLVVHSSRFDDLAERGLPLVEVFVDLREMTDLGDVLKGLIRKWSIVLHARRFVCFDVVEDSVPSLVAVV